MDTFKQNDVIALKERFETYGEGTIVVVLQKRGSRSLQVQIRHAGSQMVNRVIPNSYFRKATPLELVAHLRAIFEENPVKAIKLAYANDDPIRFASYLQANNFSYLVKNNISVIVHAMFDGKISRPMAEDFLSAFADVKNTVYEEKRND